MKEYGFTPSVWKRLSNIDKKVLRYARIMESYYIEFSPERIKMREQVKEAENKKKMDKLMESGMPKQQKGGRF